MNPSQQQEQNPTEDKENKKGKVNVTSRLAKNSNWVLNFIKSCLEQMDEEWTLIFMFPGLIWRIKCLSKDDDANS